MTESDVIVEIRSTNMACEMFNDGLYFVEQTEKENDFGDKQSL